MVNAGEPEVLKWEAAEILRRPALGVLDLEPAGAHVFEELAEKRQIHA